MKFHKSFVRSLCVVGGLFLASTGYAAAEQKSDVPAKKAEKKEAKKEKTAAKEVKKMNPNAVMVTMVTNKAPSRLSSTKRKLQFQLRTSSAM